MRFLNLPACKPKRFHNLQGGGWPQFSSSKLRFPKWRRCATVVFRFGAKAAYQKHRLPAMIKNEKFADGRSAKTQNVQKASAGLFGTQDQKGDISYVCKVKTVPSHWRHRGVPHCSHRYYQLGSFHIVLHKRGMGHYCKHAAHWLQRVNRNLFLWRVQRFP